jgi:hypothetical protein
VEPKQLEQRNDVIAAQAPASDPVIGYGII